MDIVKRRRVFPQNCPAKRNFRVKNCRPAQGSRRFPRRGGCRGPAGRGAAPPLPRPVERAAFGITAVCIVALFLTRSVIGVLFGASAEANAGVTARLPLFLVTLPLLAYTRVTIAYFYATEKTALSYVLVFSEPVLTFAVLLILLQLFKLTGVWLAIPAAQALSPASPCPRGGAHSAQESFRRDPQTASRLYKKPAPIAFAMGAAAFWGDFLCLAQACVSPR